MNRNISKNSTKIFHFVLKISFLLFGILLLSPLIGLSQEKIKSLNIRQLEIEEALRNGLKYYLEPSDYVLRVKLFGEQRSANVANETLPGFGQVRRKDISTSDKYWEISSMRVDLVMHKEVSPSVNSYIGEIIPIISGLDYERGDEFVYVPIVPTEIKAKISTGESEKTPELLSEKFIKAKSETETKEQETPKPFLETLGPVEWITGAILSLLLILMIWTLFSISRLRAKSEIQDRINEMQKSNSLPMQVNGSGPTGNEKMKKDRQERIENALIRDGNERVLQDIVKYLIGRPDWTRELIQEMTRDKQSMEKLASLFSVLGPEASRAMFRSHMSESAYLNLEQLAQETTPSAEDSAEVLKNFHMFLLTKQFVSPEQTFVDPFGFMKNLTPSQISFLIAKEPSKIKAIAISRLDNSETAAELLQELSKEERTQIVVELGKMHEIPMELVEKVGFNLAEKARNVPEDNNITVNGVRFVADLLSDSDPAMRQELMNGLRVSDLKLSEDIESTCFIFDSIPMVPNDVLKEVVRLMPPDDVITAICGSTKEIKEAVILCFPEQSRKALISSLKSKTPAKEDIRLSRKVFVEGMRGMAESDRLNLKEVNSAFTSQTNKLPALEESS